MSSSRDRVQGIKFKYRRMSEEVCEVDWVLENSDY